MLFTILQQSVILLLCQESYASQDGNKTKDMKFKLLSGDMIPLIGFGTYQIQGEELIRNVLDYALGAGYRHIDTATYYQNEEHIGQALKELLPKYNLTRKDIFITTKLAPIDQEKENAYGALEASLEKLDCEYIDLYLIHWPGIFGSNATVAENKKRRNESWKALVKGVKNGLTRNIGVSNYNVRHLKELLANDHGIKPAVNQFEWHPYYHPKKLLKLCRKENILLEAYSSLGGTDNRSLLENPKVQKIAKKLKKTSAQEDATAQEGSKAKDMKYKLLSGDLMPMVGFGTYQIQDDQTIKTVLDYALGAGYRHFDTAALYQNEQQIGKALKELLPKYNLTRRDIFITTKLAPTDQGESAYSALETSLRKLDSGYIDLYLIHWPGVFGIGGSQNQSRIKRDQSWQQMVKGVKNGLTRNIGVSNYNVHHLSELLSNNHGIKPAVNQVEWHPRYHQNELLDLCKSEGILLEAYSSLGGTGNRNLLDNPEVKRIASKLRKTPAQVLLRWALQQNIAVIPKASSQRRIQENIDLDFTIPEEDMKLLGTFNQKKFSWNPENIV